MSYQNSFVSWPTPGVARHMRVAVVGNRIVGVSQADDGSVWVARARVPLA